MTRCGQHHTLFFPQIHCIFLHIPCFVMLCWIVHSQIVKFVTCHTSIHAPPMIARKQHSGPWNQFLKCNSVITSSVLLTPPPWLALPLTDLASSPAQGRKAGLEEGDRQYGLLWFYTAQQGFRKVGITLAANFAGQSPLLQYSKQRAPHKASWRNLRSLI